MGEERDLAKTLTRTMLQRDLQKKSGEKPNKIQKDEKDKEKGKIDKEG